MHLLGALVGGSIGAAIGGVVWALVAYFGHVEVGWIAWGVGLAAGAGASIGAKGQGGPQAGVLAAVLAVVAILGAKYAVVSMFVNEGLSEIQTTADAAASPDVSDTEYWTSYVADQIIEQKAAAGERIEWPGGVEPEYPEKEADYPKAIWADAKARWGAMTSDAQQEFRRVADEHAAQEIKTMLAEIGSEAAGRGFTESFGVLDLLFGALAIITAFKVGSGSMPGTEKAAT